MGQEIRIEDALRLSHITTRTIASELWYINNRVLEEQILTYLARYAEQRGVTLYAVALMGNHYHLLAKFRYANRASFMRDLNAIIARLVGWYVREFKRGKLHGKRYAEQKVADDGHALTKLIYLALQPMNSGLARTHREFEQYNSFSDAARGFERSFKYFDREAYRKARRKDPKVRPEQFRMVYKLKYSKLPGCEHLSQKEYGEKLRRVFEAERQRVIQEREKSGKGFVGRERLRATKVGSRPKNTKKSSYAVAALANTKQKREEEKTYYFEIRYRYRMASEIYRKDPRAEVRFPAGTYPPPRICPCLGTG